MGAARFFKDLSWNAIASVAVAIQGLVTVPVLARSLSTAEYGVWALFLSTLGLLGTLALLGSDTALARFVPTARDDEERGRILATGVAIPLVVASAAGALIAVGSGILVALTSIPRTFFLVLAVGLPVEALMWVTYGYLRGSHRVRAFAMARVGVAVAFLALLAVGATLDLPLAWYLGAFVAAEATALITLLAVALPVRSAFRADRARAARFARFALPLVPTVLTTWVVDSSDRYVITFFHGLDEVGIYAVGYSVGAAVLMFWSPVGLLLLPRASAMVAEGRREDAARLLRLLAGTAGVLAIGAVAGIAGIAPQFLRVFAGDDYVAAAPVVALTAAAFAFHILGSVYQVGLYVEGRTVVATVAFVAAALANLALNVLLVPRFGMVAAAVATAASYLLLALIIRAFGMRELAAGGEWRDALRAVPAGVAVFLALWVAPLEGWTMVAVGVPAGFVLFMVLAWGMRALRWADLVELAHLLGGSRRAAERAGS